MTDYDDATGAGASTERRLEMIRVHGNGRRSPSAVLLLASLALVAAFVVSSCGGGGGNGTEAAATATAPVETATDEAVTTDAGPEPITAAEERWVKLLTRYNERFEREYFRGGAVTHGSMRREIRLFSDCGAMVRRAGDPGRMAPAAKRARRACERLDRAARLLEQAISVTDAGGAVVAGSDDERIFDRAHGGAREAAGNAHYGLQRAQEIAQDIKSTLPS
jgi:hypothetical protein